MEVAVAVAPAAVDIKHEDDMQNGAHAVQQFPGLENGVGTAAVKSEHAFSDPMQLVSADGQHAAAVAQSAAPEAGAAAEPERKRRHKWGPPAAGEFSVEEQKPKKRRSRWETSTELVVATSNSGQIIIPGQIPKEVTICGGMKVRGCAVGQQGRSGDAAVALVPSISWCLA
jgi:hypothetical protein